MITLGKNDGLEFTRIPTLVWRFRNYDFSFTGKPLIMGILNVTPDSFSDGGNYFDRPKAIEQAWQMIGEGADLIDVGGESSRPGADSVSITEEIDRIVPVLEAVSGKTDVPFSVDTYKAEVAEAAIQAGAAVINDISGARFDPRILKVASEYDAGLVLMHIKGTPKTMQKNPVYDDVVAEIKRYLGECVDYALQAGIKKERLVIDPGIGFGKRWFDNYDIINRLSELASLERPILIGASRKSFLGKFLPGEPKHRLEGSLIASAIAMLHGANILRVHDVKATRQAATIAAVFQQRSLGIKPEKIEEYFCA